MRVGQYKDEGQNKNIRKLYTFLSHERKRDERRREKDNNF